MEFNLNERHHRMKINHCLKHGEAFSVGSVCPKCKPPESYCRQLHQGPFEKRYWSGLWYCKRCDEDILHGKDAVDELRKSL